MDVEVKERLARVEAKLEATQEHLSALSKRFHAMLISLIGTLASMIVAVFLLIVKRGIG